VSDERGVSHGNIACDNTVFVKILPELADVMAGAESDLPNEGGKEHYILDPENTEKVRKVIEISSSRRCPGRGKRNEAK
jgi:hypothetical protein